MGLTKTELFTAAQNELSTLAKAFAHPARIAIIQLLLESKTCINSDLVEELGLAQATISQHLRELKEAGILQGTINGPRMNYCINPSRWKEIQALFNDLFNQFNGINPSNCC